MKKSFIRVVSLCVVAVLLFGFSAQAAMGPSFTHWETAGKRLTVPTKDMYRPVMTISADDLGLEDPLEGITDIFCAEDGKVYVLCGEEGRLFVLNSDYTFDREIIVMDVDGMDAFYQGALGVYVEGETIYLCDTMNGRILLVDQEGNAFDTIERPVHDVIPEDYQFQPVELSRDADNNLYVLSFGSYHGALIFNEELEFTGFYGANTVEYTVLDFFGYVWDLLTMTDSKRQQQIRTLPYAFVSMTSDKDGFIYTTTGTAAGQIKMLSPGGTNILKSHGINGEAVDASSYKFAEDIILHSTLGWLSSNMAVIAVNDDGYIYALETTFSYVYIYDNECNLLSAFGGGAGEAGKTNESGMFRSASAMALKGDHVIVGDSYNNNITVFEMTEYGALVQKAQKMHLAGDYIDAKPLWEEVLAQDGNSRLAYRGLAKAYYALGDFDKAMEYAEIAYDYVTYDQAYRQVRNARIADNFIWVFIGIIVAVGLLIAFLLYMKKRETSMFKNVKVRTLMNTFIHPFQTFTDIKYKGYGSMPAAIIIIALFAFTSTLKITASSFLFRTVDVYNYNSLFTLATTAGLLILWIVANWLACTLMEGKGRMNEIAIVTAYAMVPMIAFNVIYTVLSYSLSYEDAAILNGLATVMTIFTAFLLIVAIMTVHEYTFGKFVLSTVITIFFMILIIFVIFMMVIMLQQLFNFLKSLYTEVAYR